MVKEILNMAGVTHRRNRFPKPPAGTYAVWNDFLDTDGPDGMPPQIFQHNVTIVVYEPRPDDETEASIEAAMNSYGLHWHKEDRYWVDDEQLYQVTYDYSYVEKRRN